LGTSHDRSSTSWTKDEVVAVIVRAAADHNAHSSRQVAVERGEAAELWGAAAPLDSIGLVGILIAVEQDVAAQFGQQIVLTNAQTMARADRPFASIGALARHVVSLLGQRPP